MAETILVIDDEEETLRAVRLGLRHAGYEVETAKDGNEGFQKALKNRPFSVVLDLAMPGVDGLGFLKMVRSNAQLKNLPVVVLTGQDTYESMRQSYEGGSDLFLTKPADIKQIVGAIRFVTKGKNVK